MVSTPQAPDPATTAAAQAKYNTQTAQQTQEINMVGQNTPYGSLSYQQTGTNADGTPRYTSTTSLSPGMQGLFNSNLSAAQGNSNVENQLLANAGTNVAKGLDLSEGATEQRLNQLGLADMQPQQQQATSALQQRLYNQGLRPGDSSYDYQTNQLAQQQGQQLNDLYLQGHQTAVNDAVTAYNSPINALGALRSNSQVSQPGIGTTSTPTTSVAGTNYSGLVAQNYQDQLAQSSATMGGLFGLGGTLGGAAIQKGLMFSDRRLKADIRRVGALDNGLPVYAYRYKAGGPMQIGLMADEVARIHPEAVHHVNGFGAVDYSRAVEAI